MCVCERAFIVFHCVCERAFIVFHCWYIKYFVVFLLTFINIVLSIYVLWLCHNSLVLLSILTYIIFITMFVFRTLIQI